MVTYQYQQRHERQEGDPLSPPLPTPARISFSSSEPLEDEDDDEEFICINPEKPTPNNNCEFEFFSSGKDAGGKTNTMLTADELFHNGKLLPFRQNQPCGAAGGIKTRVVREVGVDPEEEEEEEEEIVAVKVEEKKAASSNTVRPSWYLDEDPSPRPPKCTVLWKELLRLRKHRGSSSLSPSSSSSSTSSSSSSMANVATKEDGGKEPGTGNLKEIYLQRIRKGLEKTRSGSMRIRPIASLPVCKHVRTNSNGGGLPPLFPIRK